MRRPAINYQAVLLCCGLGFFSGVFSCQGQEASPPKQAEEPVSSALDPIERAAPQGAPVENKPEAPPSNDTQSSPPGTEGKNSLKNFDEARAQEVKLLDKSRRYLGNRYISLTETMDNFLAGKDLERSSNTSYLKALGQATWFERNETENDLKLQGKLDLPGAKKRFRLFIDSDPDEQNSIEERNRSVSSGERLKEDDSVAGLEIAQKKPLTKWKSSLSLGAKLNSGLNPLVRYRARKYWALNSKWSSFYRQDFWYLDGTGWGETSRAELTRSLGDNAWLQFMAEVEHADEDIPWQYIHTWRIDQKLNRDYALTWRVGLTGEGSADDLSDDRFFNISLRSRIYRNWVFLHLTPELYFATEENYKTEHAFTLKLELFLTEHN